jgi:hypothetical protein
MSNNMRGSALQISLAMAAGFGLATLWYKIKSQDGVQEKQVQEANDEQYPYLPPNASALLRRVSSSWSLLRRARGSKKIRGLASGAFRGGDVVVNTDGLASTCSFCFKVGSKAYGLTVGHLAPVIGDSVYAFVGEGPLVKLLGVVVSRSVSTDSLIFSIAEDIPIFEYRLAENSILGERALTSPTPGMHVIHPRGTIMVGYGAQGRGTIGAVSEPGLSQRVGYCNAGDIGISDPNSGVALTEDGDCGAIFIHKEGRYGTSMHNILWTKPNGKSESYGVPLATVFANHVLLGGTEDSTTGVEQIQQASILGIQSHNFAHHEIQIIFENGGKQTHNLGKPMKLTFK